MKKYYSKIIAQLKKGDKGQRLRLLQIQPMQIKTMTPVRHIKQMNVQSVKKKIFLKMLNEKNYIESIKAKNRSKTDKNV